jgi:hypothetical protein
MLKHRNYIAWMVISLLAAAPQGCEKDEAPPIVQTVSTAMLEETIVGPTRLLPISFTVDTPWGSNMSCFNGLPKASG